MPERIKAGNPGLRVAVAFDRLLKTSEARVKESGRDLSAFRDPEGVARTLTALREGPANVHVAPRTRRLFAKLEPELLAWCARVAEPDAALNRLVRFVDAYGTRGLLFETMLASPKLLELLVCLFDASAIFSDVVIRRPQLIEEITRSKTLGLSISKEQFLEDLQAQRRKIAAARLGPRLSEQRGGPDPFTGYPRNGFAGRIAGRDDGPRRGLLGVLLPAAG